MKAEQAREISKKKEITIQEIYDTIKTNAEHGNRAFVFFQYIPSEHITVLLSNGYKISTFVDNVGMNATKVEW